MCAASSIVTNPLEITGTLNSESTMSVSPVIDSVPSVSILASMSHVAGKVMSLTVRSPVRSNDWDSPTVAVEGSVNASLLNGPYR